VEDTKTYFYIDNLLLTLHFSYTYTLIRLPRLNLQCSKETFIAILSEHILNFVLARTMSKLLITKHFTETRVIRVHYIMYYIHINIYNKLKIIITFYSLYVLDTFLRSLYIRLYYSIL